MYQCRYCWVWSVSFWSLLHVFVSGCVGLRYISFASSCARTGENVCVAFSRVFQFFFLVPHSAKKRTEQLRYAGNRCRVLHYHEWLIWRVCQLFCIVQGVIWIIIIMFSRLTYLATIHTRVDVQSVCLVVMFAFSCFVYFDTIALDVPNDNWSSKHITCMLLESNRAVET